VFSQFFELRRACRPCVAAASKSKTIAMTGLPSRSAAPICRALIFRPIDLVPAFHALLKSISKISIQEGEALLAETQRTN
jgi:hypothetical protein